MRNNCLILREPWLWWPLTYGFYFPWIVKGLFCFVWNVTLRRDSWWAWSTSLLFLKNPARLHMYVTQQSTRRIFYLFKIWLFGNLFSHNLSWLQMCGLILWAGGVSHRYRSHGFEFKSRRSPYIFQLILPDCKTRSSLPCIYMIIPIFAWHSSWVCYEIKAAIEVSMLRATLPSHRVRGGTRSEK